MVLVRSATSSIKGKKNKIEKLDNLQTNWNKNLNFINKSENEDDFWILGTQLMVLVRSAIPM